MADLNFAQSLRASLEANVTNNELVCRISKLSANERENLLRRLPTMTHVERDEATEDFHKGALLGTPLGSLKDATVSLLYRKRVLWLVLLVFGNLFSGAGIAAFEDIIAADIVLVFSCLCWLIAVVMQALSQQH